MTFLCSSRGVVVINYLSIKELRSGWIDVVKYEMYDGVVSQLGCIIELNKYLTIFTGIRLTHLERVANTFVIDQKCCGIHGLNNAMMCSVIQIRRL